MDDKVFDSIVKTKCNLCFRKDSPEDRCMLYSSKHAGVKPCSGPFKNQEDRMEKVREYFGKEEKQKVEWKRAIRDARINTYSRNKKLFDDWDIKRNLGD